VLRAALFVAGLFAVLVLEHVYWAHLPGSVLHVVFVLWLWARGSLSAGVPSLLMLEWGLTGAPLGALLSLWLCLVALDRGVRERVNWSTPSLVAVLAAVVELLRHLWLSWYGSLAGVPVTSLDAAHLLVDTLVVTLVAMLLLVQDRRAWLPGAAR